MITKKAVRQTYTGKVIRVNEVDLDFGNGKQATFELITFNTVTGVSALPITPDGVMLLKHYQAGLDRDSYCLPSGGLNQGEVPEERMQLELQEELGYRAGSLTLMLKSHPLPGYIGSEPGYLYLATDLRSSRLEGDEHYSIVVQSFTWDEIWRLVQGGEILDTRTLVALLYYDKFHHTGD